MNNFFFNWPEFRYPGLNWVLFSWRHRLDKSNTNLSSLTSSYPQNTNRRSHVKCTRKISSQKGIRAKALEEKDSCFVFSLQPLIHSLPLLCSALCYGGISWAPLLAGFQLVSANEKHHKKSRDGVLLPCSFPASLEVIASFHICPLPRNPFPWPQLFSELQPHFVPLASLIPVVITVPTNSSLWLPQHPSMVLLTLP